ncbi:hypothetical protein PIB30_049167 [Stylosanthes scabra]|uniref:RRM domain-containing protein n=1 Tax=Stylosanthes scabra TaxID=79078 RepID=A0ABU6RHK8_9FABA|nr:hypothetical protein [Stylosanthes scabra]
MLEEETRGRVLGGEHQVLRRFNIGKNRPTKINYCRVMAMRMMVLVGSFREEKRRVKTWSTRRGVPEGKPNKWDQIENQAHSLFVDNLLDNISRRELFVEFGKDGFVVDVFVSRKKRRNIVGLFAFVWFDGK